MSNVIADISISLDGFVTGPNPGAGNGLGDGARTLHRWAMGSDDPIDAEVLREATERSGAVIMGRRLFDIIDAPTGWSDERGYGARHAAAPPFFVLTHRPPAQIRLALDFTFVTDGLAEAIRQAQARAGDRDVVIMGGGQVVAQALSARLLDELRLHVAPVLLGAGTALFGADHHELVQLSVRPSATATHITYGFASVSRGS